MSDKWEVGYIAPGGEIKKLGRARNVSLDIGAEYAEDVYYDVWKPEHTEISLSIDLSKKDFERFMISLGLSTFKYEEHVYPAEYFDEMCKLEAYLKRENIEYKRMYLPDCIDEAGHVLCAETNQIIAFKDGERWFDAISHRSSYGHEDGLLEIMGDIVYGEDRVEGWLTAADVIERVKAKENR